MKINKERHKRFWIIGFILIGVLATISFMPLTIPLLTGVALYYGMCNLYDYYEKVFEFSDSNGAIFTLFWVVYIIECFFLLIMGILFTMRSTNDGFTMPGALEPVYNFLSNTSAIIRDYIFWFV